MGDGNTNGIIVTKSEKDHHAQQKDLFTEMENATKDMSFYKIKNVLTQLSNTTQKQKDVKNGVTIHHKKLNVHVGTTLYMEPKNPNVKKSNNGDHAKTVE